MLGLNTYEYVDKANNYKDIKEGNFRPEGKIVKWRNIFICMASNPKYVGRHPKKGKADSRDSLGCSHQECPGSWRHYIEQSSSLWPRGWHDQHQEQKTCSICISLKTSAGKP